MLLSLLKQIAGFDIMSLNQGHMLRSHEYSGIGHHSSLEQHLIYMAKVSAVAFVLHFYSSNLRGRPFGPRTPLYRMARPHCPRADEVMKEEFAKGGSVF